MAHQDIPIPVDRRRDVPRPPGPSTFEATLNLLRTTRTPGFVAEIVRTYPSIAHARALGYHRYFLTDPELVVKVFIDHAHDVVKGPVFDLAKPFVGNGLLTSEGPTHLANRRLAQPAFHRDRIAEYSRWMVSIARECGLAWEDGKHVDMSVEMTELTMTIVGRTLFSADVSSQSGDLGQSIRDMLHVLSRYGALGEAIWRYPSPVRSRSIKALTRLDALVDQMIVEHRESGIESDLLSLLLASNEDGTRFTNEQVRDEVVTLVLAGHETTATALTWAWMLLALHPDVAAWMHEELDEVLGGRVPTMDDLGQLQRTNAIIAESIRLYPPVWIYGRRTLVDLEVAGWLVPAGANVVASPYAFHHSARWWPKPEQFDPSRWFTNAGVYSETAPNVTRGVWAPFGWGSRKCIGEHFAWSEAILVLATLGQQWAPGLATSRPVNPEAAITLRPHGGMPMVLHRR